MKCSSKVCKVEQVFPIQLVFGSTKKRNDRSVFYQVKYFNTEYKYAFYRMFNVPIPN